MEKMIRRGSEACLTTTRGLCFVIAGQARPMFHYCGPNKALKPYC